MAQTARFSADPNADPNAETCGNDETPPDGEMRRCETVIPVCGSAILQGENLKLLCDLCPKVEAFQSSRSTAAPQGGSVRHCPGV